MIDEQYKVGIILISTVLITHLILRKKNKHKSKFLLTGRNRIMTEERKRVDVDIVMAFLVCFIVVITLLFCTRNVGNSGSQIEIDEIKAMIEAQGETIDEQSKLISEQKKFFAKQIDETTVRLRKDLDKLYSHTHSWGKIKFPDEL